MATLSPPKPWERAGAGATTAAAPTPAASAPPAAATSSSLTAPPAIPERPSSLSSVANRNASAYSTNTMNRPYGTSPYGIGSYGSSPYGFGASPYNRFGGGMYGSSYGGYGGMGAMGGMGGYGGMYGGGYGGMGGGYGGMPGDPNDPNQSLTNNFAQSTQATFQILESIVGAFGGFAQMLESTYYATHQSFFAMVNVADQFGNLRQTLGSVLGIYAIARWLRTLIAKLTGRPPPADATSLTPAAFAGILNGGASGATVGPDGRPVPKPSKKPFIVFILAVFGLPYLMGKLIRALAANHQAQQQQQQQQQGQLPNGQVPVDPSKLDFARLKFDFPSAEAVASGGFDQSIDLQVKKDELVAVLSKSAPDTAPGQESQWWLCRARDGRKGWLPAAYLTIIRRTSDQALKQIADVPANPSSRANTMPASVTGAPGLQKPANATAPVSRASTLTGSQFGMTKGETLEGIQKAWVNDR